jgi:exodeoxyribonuclease VII large subunit
MAKPAKSQWDFGELFPPEPPPKPVSVSELTSRIRSLLEKEVGPVWVTGEITNLRAQSSGHIYFTLKDATAQISCVLFRGERDVNRSLIQEGCKVNLHGEVTVYEPRGQYQLRVTGVEPQGLGPLQAAFEKLKQKLQAEGLFATERKRPLPRYPERIGVATSPTGAALRDVLHVIERRQPSLELVLAPCRVQGDGAAAEIAAAIRLLNAFHAAERTHPDGRRGLDYILVTRGGGSLEDLWAFNEEVVARAIFESALPVVSAVGHEIDFTISDFVADLRAATPSAAAEIITEGAFSSLQFLRAASERLRRFARQNLEDKNYVFGQALQRLARLHPRRRLNDSLQRLDDLQASLLRNVRQGAKRERTAWETLCARLLRARPAQVLQRRRDALDRAVHSLQEHAPRRVEELKQRLAGLDGRLRLLGPEQVLARGYSLTLDSESGKILRDASGIEPGRRLKTRLKTGSILSRVEPPENASKASPASGTPPPPAT